MVVPPILNISSSEDTDDNDVAFKIINNDNLPMAIVGESILKPFGRDNNNVIKEKPNVIVYPTRRLPNNLEDNKTKSFTRSNGHINQPNEQRNNSSNIKKNLSHSHGNLNANKKDDYGLDKNFTKTLDAKLRKLQKDEKIKRVEQHKRPLFVTTVKKGTFLQPPPEIATLLGFRVDEQERKDKKKLYSYSSKPRILNRVIINNNNNVKIGHKGRCEAAAKAAAAVAANIAGIQHNFSDKDVNSNNISSSTATSKRLR